MEHRRFLWRLMVAVSWLDWSFLLLLWSLLLLLVRLKALLPSTPDDISTCFSVLCTCLLFDRSPSIPPSLRLVRSFPPPQLFCRDLSAFVMVCLQQDSEMGMIATWSHGTEVYLWWTRCAHRVFATCKRARARACGCNRSIAQSECWARAAIEYSKLWSLGLNKVQIRRRHD